MTSDFEYSGLSYIKTSNGVILDPLSNFRINYAQTQISEPIFHLADGIWLIV